ncbi:hypothetical protein CIHG_06437 [Coccidioides immitis H538.4]|uniref:Uncharacterized protein n=1 Tax=Coccidioides immitis H538.4 TaxID=396776 RepID=A0A0J8RX97_COCIT|nr:hypothetical protein CIHG_06437 [Coccidioides immitis H538.4]
MTDEAHHPQTTDEGGGVSGEVTSPASWYMITYSNAWFQVVLISFICFCCPGPYRSSNCELTPPRYIAVGPIFLYFFYGAYDALWQSFCYWLIGTMSNSAAITAVLVGAYKTFQAAGGAMACSINALHKPPMTQPALY